MSFTDSTITLPFIQPSFKPQIILTKDVEVHFSLEFLSCATNALNNRPIPIKQIKWVGIKGSSPVLGGWGGNWTEADTLVDPATGYPTMLKMNDSGVDGDETAGDGKWTKKVIFPVGSIGGLIEFKFGCVYPGADTANGGKFPLNNEMPGELNHQFMLVARIDGNPIQISEYFGPTSDCQSGVDDRDLHPLSRAKNYSLEQNYPNPFNPTTKIKFSLLHDEFVTLKIYNIAGNEIAALVKQQLKEGTYETTFDADKLSTGVYFYRLTAGEFSVAKKMIFMK